MSKPIIIHLTEEVHQKAIKASRAKFGSTNVSAYVRTLIIEDNEK
tara:strand:- start:1160 stop:1294 length:135 start_codon:yes stop_codon:yes gene_type:complete